MLAPAHVSNDHNTVQRECHRENIKHHLFVADLAPSRGELGKIGNSFLALFQNLAHKRSSDQFAELFACDLTNLILCPLEIVALHLTDFLLFYVRYLYSRLFPLS